MTGTRDLLRPLPSPLPNRARIWALQGDRMPPEALSGILAEYAESSGTPVDYDLIRQYVEGLVALRAESAALARAAEENKSSYRALRKEYRAKGLDTAMVDKFVQMAEIAHELHCPTEAMAPSLAAVEQGLGFAPRD